MTEFDTKVDVRNLSQPDAYTCQATCIAMVVKRSALAIRAELDELPGDAGNPYNMGVVLERYLGSKYIFDPDASLNNVKDWITKEGEFLITHGWFTPSGHVLGLDGVLLDSGTFSYKVSVKDPWSEFDAPSWSYNKPSVEFYDGYYSSYCLYAAIVASMNYQHAREIYKRGELESKRTGAWVHRIKP
jgi:hypothetical protein